MEEKILIESMTPARYNPPSNNPLGIWSVYFIRCWREETAYDKEISLNTGREIEAEVSKMKERLSVFEVAKRLLAMERMNAVEVKDNSGVGCVLYKNWP